LPAPLAVLLGIVLASAPPATPGPTLAREDTMSTQVPEVLVTAPRVTLDEILDRVARGEARRESLLTDQTFIATFRVVRGARDSASRRLVAETVAKVYKQRPDRVRSVVLRQGQEKEHKGAGVDVNFRADMSEEIVNFAFRPEARREFRYRILGRDLVADHLIYRIAFEPRSPIDLRPSGLVWVDTNDFVIVRQEVNFDRSPVPLFLKGIDRMVIERHQVDGYWVLWRVLVRGEGTFKLPVIGKSFDITIRFDDYAINRGIDPAVFEAGSARR